MQIGLRMLIVLSASLLISSCASLELQQGKAFSDQSTKATNSAIIHRLIVVGDAGKATSSQGQSVLTAVQQRNKQTELPTTLLFAGDNIYPSGLVDKKHKQREQALAQLQAQIDLAKALGFPAYFIPGNHDWYSGLSGLMEQKNIVETQLGKKAFLPRKYTPIEAIELTQDIALIAVDTEWFIQDWNLHPDMNEESEIRTREDFLEEFRSLLNKHQNKTVYVALHHPVLNNGSHAGNYSLNSHLQPKAGVYAPVIGSLIAYARKFSGASPADDMFRPYQELRQRLITMAMEYQRVIFVSGHDHNLQYISENGIKQLISGSASKIEPARARQNQSVSIGAAGYAVLNLHQDQSVSVQLHTLASEKPVWEHTILAAVAPKTYPYDSPTEQQQMASVYTAEETTKSGFYRWLFGSHYRSLYAKEISFNVADLTTLNGGMQPLISGGGMQSESLRFEDAQGKQWVMRALRKSPTRFVQAGLIKNAYIKNQVEDTFMERFIADFYTATHPYMAFSLHHLSQAAELYHTLPEPFYLPKQPRLEHYNENYGDALFMLEDRPHKSQKDRPNFGNGEDIVGTYEMLTQLEKDEKYSVDTDMYIRARLFDMLIGDWDRHQDQWRWVEKTQGDTVVYQPIPRDRDQAFAHLDGALLGRLIKLPPLRHMQPYQKAFAHPRWINKTAFPLDRHLLQTTQWQAWEKQALFLQSAVTDEAIANLFASLPAEVREYRRKEITEILQDRRAHLLEYAKRYYSEMVEIRQLTGTNKKDYFEIETSEKGVKVQYFRNKKTGLQKRYAMDFLAESTKELWIYALDDDDSIVVTGTRSPIKLRLIGGKNHDTYRAESENRVRIYDYRSKENTIGESGKFRAILKDNYQQNQFDFRRAPLNVLTVLPDVGYNPDNGVMLGLNGTYTHQNFLRSPFAHKHNLRAKFDFAYSGFLMQYSGLFKNYSRNWYWGLDVMATNSNYSQNFFGWGNNSRNLESDFEMNFHRVLTSQYSITPSYQYKGRNGGHFTIGLNWQQIHIEPMGDRLWDILEAPQAYTTENYSAAFVNYTFENFNDAAFPTLGMRLEVDYGFRADINNWEAQHQWASAQLDWIFPLTASENLTWKHSLYGKQVWGSQFAFYQAAHLGAKNMLRGYRDNRFIGESAAAYSTDIRFAAGQLKQSFLPMKYGTYLGYDIGRVWLRGEDSRRWHQSAGGGLWLTVLESATLNAGLFKGTDRWMFSFGMGYNF